MHITIEIDDGDEQSRVTFSGAATGAAAPSSAADAAASAAPLDAGPAPDLFATQSEAPPGATDLSVGEVTMGGSVVSGGTAPDLS